MLTNSGEMHTGKKVQADKWGVNNGESDEKAVNV